MKIIENMPIREYHAHASISKSGLDKVNRSIGHYLASLERSHAPTDAMTLGSAIHAAALEPDDFESRYIVRPSVDRRTKEGKAIYADWLATHEDALSTGHVEEIKADGRETALRCADAIHAHPAAVELLAGAVIESSVFWTDPSTGLDLRCRPDAAVFGSHLVDIKSTADSSDRSFATSMAKYRYHVQEAMYLEGTELGEFYFVAVETSAPYTVAVYRLTGESSNRGHEQYRADLEKYAAYKAKVDSGQEAFTGYSNSVRAIDLPGWA